MKKYSFPFWHHYWCLLLLVSVLLRCRDTASSDMCRFKNGSKRILE